MKTCVFLALCAVAAANTIGGFYGYDVPVDCPKAQGWFYVEFYLSPTDNVPNNTSMAVRVSSTDPPSIRGSMNVYRSFNAPADLQRRPPIGEQFMGKGNNQREGKGKFQTNQTGLYYISGQCNCNGNNQCVNQESQLGFVTARLEIGGQYYAFPIKPNPYTSNYTNEVNQGEFGPAGLLDLNADTNVYIWLHAYDPTTEVILVYSKDMPIVKDSALPLGADTPTLKRYPAATSPAMAGTYQTGPVALSQGRWYIAPFLATKAAINKPQEFRFAVGLNQEPDPSIPLTGAAVVLQSSSIVALFACVLAAILARF